jgi:hypothetical protein
MFRTVPLSIIRTFSLYTQQWYMSANMYDIFHCCVENSWWWTEELSETCGVSLQNKNFEKLVSLVGSIIRNALNTFIYPHGQTDKREDVLATITRKQAFDIQKDCLTIKMSCTTCCDIQHFTMYPESYLLVSCISQKTPITPFQLH